MAQNADPESYANAESFIRIRLGCPWQVARGRVRTIHFGCGEFMGLIAGEDRAVYALFRPDGMVLPQAIHFSQIEDWQHIL